MKKLFSLFLLIIFAIALHAQKNIIVTIGDNKFTKEEFELIYRKNNTQLNDESEIKTPEEYVDLFIDYKLKVIEAENRGMDTIQAFIDELAGYRDELAKPYLTDVTVTDSMVREVYFRSVNDIKASHILLNIPPDATPEDTLKIYNKIIDLRNQFISGEHTFQELAINNSNDPSVHQNGGDLGYFKAFSMITAFEDAAYNTPVGEVSMPVRTQHGYHIIYVTDLRKTEGEVKVAHIMKIFKNINNITPEEEKRYKAELDSIYAELKKGADFGKAVRDHSDDRSTVKNDGEMSWLNRTFGVDEFIDAAFAMEIGDISEPIRTPYGWHILKLNDKRAPRTFEEMEYELGLKVKRDADRSKHSKQSYLSKKRTEYNFTRYDQNIEKFINYLRSQGDTLYNEISPEMMKLPMFKVAEVNYTVADFMKLQNIKKKNSGNFLTNLLISHIEAYADEVIDFYENTTLESKHPEFKQIMQEYRDGMLLFAIMQEEVWNKAAIDVDGLQAYYEKNPSKYLWDTHFAGLLIRATNQEAYDSCKTLIANGITDEKTILERINTDGKTNIRITRGRWAKGDNDRIDYFIFDGKEPSRFNKDLEFVHGEMVEAGLPKTLEEAKGLYIADYQKVLEQEWMEYLRKKYKVKVNKKLLKQVKKI